MKIRTKLILLLSTALVLTMVLSTSPLARSMDEATVNKRPRPLARGKTTQQRRDEARSAYYDHGESARAPGSRAIEPGWRTPDKPSTDRWPARATQPAPVKPRVV